MKGDLSGTPHVWLSAPGINDIGSVQVQQAAASFLACLEALRNEVRGIRSELCSYFQRMKSEWISCMARSKDGFTPEQAKKLFYDFRKKKPDDSEEAPEPDKPDDTEARFERIMVYMEDTSRKLDRIESDIELLKEQVTSILKRL